MKIKKADVLYFNLRHILRLATTHVDSQDRRYILFNFGAAVGTNLLGP